MPSPRLQIAALAALALSACGSEPRVAPPQDPVLAAALADPLMTDMELAARNRGDDALSGNGLPEGGLPPWEAGPEEVAAARAAAVRLAGGTLRPPPSFDPGEGKGGAGEHAVTPVQIAARAGLAGGACAGGLQYGAIWAARLPAGVEIYPRGHTLDAAGIDGKGCALRIVRYASPAPLADIAGFYATRLPGARFRGQGGDGVAEGAAGPVRFVIRLRRGADGLSEVDIATRAD